MTVCGKYFNGNKCVSQVMLQIVEKICSIFKYANKMFRIYITQCIKKCWLICQNVQIKYQKPIREIVKM